MKNYIDTKLQYIREQETFERGRTRGKAETALIVLPFLVMALIGIIIMLS